MKNQLRAKCKELGAVRIESQNNLVAKQAEYDKQMKEQKELADASIEDCNKKLRDLEQSNRDLQTKLRAQTQARIDLRKEFGKTLDPELGYVPEGSRKRKASDDVEKSGG